MTREEAIKRIQDHMFVHHIGEYPHIHIKEALDMAISALQEQEDRRWIPVAERLPEKPTKCLVYTKRGKYGGHEITYYNEGFYLQYSNVTHWMPLPEPPKEDT